MEEREISLRQCKRLKRNLLGFCGSEGIKSLDEISMAIFRSKIVTSLDEARKLAPNLVKRTIEYAINGFDDVLYLSFESIGDENYKVQSYGYMAN